MLSDLRANTVSDAFKKFIDSLIWCIKKENVQYATLRLKNAFRGLHGRVVMVSDL